MIANFVYILVTIILLFVLYLAVKAITRGVEAKQVLKEEKDLELNKNNENQNSEVVTQLSQLKDLYDNGILSKDEFQKAKDKILK